MADDQKGSGALEVAVSFVIGAAAGFILGILFAPASGKETRQKIKEQAVKTGEKAKEGYEKFAHEAEKSVHFVRDKAHDGVEAIRDFVEKKREEMTKPPAGPKKETK
ncbi:MAG: YtxH domain-containing protein [Candidatus Aminicenantes bacterium]|nr:YtxH domain-containing protein [Candidatus Aminicenantes bacterium]